MKKLALLFTAALSLSAATKSDMVVSTDWLAAHRAEPKLVILHISATKAAYDAGHIPGARFILLSDLAITREGVHNELPATEDLKKLFETAGVSDDSRVIVYSDATVLPATRAYFTLDYLGHGDSASLLDGGLEKWRRESHDLTKDVPTPIQGHLTPHPKSELNVQMDAVKLLSAKSAAPNAILLDARSAADYTGEKGAHIPGALNVFWTDGQIAKDNQALKPEADLRKLYETAGVTPDRKVVTYCNSGMQASQSYFTLKYLGYDVKMYDGSMSEWNLKNGPTEK